MAFFQYEGRDKAGGLVKGIGEAESIEELKEKLRRANIYVVKCKNAASSQLKTGVYKLKTKELIAFCEQMKTLLGVGITMTEAISTIEEQTTDIKAKRFFGQLRQDIMNGKSLYEAFASPGIVVPTFFLGMVKAGESGGILEEMLEKIALFLKKQSEFKAKIMMALAYPSVMLAVGLLATIGLLLFVFPKFADIYGKYNAKLPALTLAVMYASNFLKTKWYIYITALVLAFITYTVLNKKADWRYRFDQVRLSIPIVGPLIKYGILSRFCHTLGLLLDAGVPIVSALITVGQMEKNEVIKRVGERITNAVKNGDTLINPIRESGIFAPLTVQMIKVGENSGMISGMLSKAGDYYDIEIDQLTRKIAALAEPVLICVIGLVVGTLVVAMYLPVFGIMQVIQGGN